MMPNKTIYVSDTDLPVFERAQELAGENLSSTIVQALRNFVQAYETRAAGFRDVVVRVGSDFYTRKQFRGRLLAKGYMETHADRPGAPEEPSSGPDEEEYGGPWMMGQEPFGKHKRGQRPPKRPDWPPFGPQGGPEDVHYNILEIYQTAKERIALYTREFPNWWPGVRDQRKWERNWWRWERNWDRMMDHAAGFPGPRQWRGTYTLEVFDSLDEIKDRIPPDLYQGAKQALTGEFIEKLDI
jgi:EXLDI family protein